MSPAKAAPDPQCVAAVDLARAAAADVGADTVGEPAGYDVEQQPRLVTHYFACTHPGYAGWRWAVTVVRAAWARVVTVDEVALLPGPAALVAPGWVPWSERVEGADLHPGDLLPTRPDDPNLVPGYTDTAGAADTALALVAELGLGRVRVLSAEGRDAAADRWYAGISGPHNAETEQAPGPCATCGFLVHLSGPLGGMFGACANPRSPRDGQVVSFDHGCGAHSEAGIAVSQERAGPPVWDTVGFDDL